VRHTIGETFSPEAHIQAMTAATAIKRSSPAKLPRTYRGVKLQAITGPTRFSLAQIKRG
jgi:hypothetical protein